MPEHDPIIAAPVEDAATYAGRFVKPAEVAESGDAFIIVGVDTDHEGRYGREVVYSIRIKGAGPARLSFSATARRTKHALEVADRLKGAAAVGPFRLTPHDFDGRDGEPVRTYVFSAHETAGPVDLADYDGDEA